MYRHEAQALLEKHQALAGDPEKPKPWMVDAVLEAALTGEIDSQRAMRAALLPARKAAENLVISFDAAGIVPPAQSLLPI